MARKPRTAGSAPDAAYPRPQGGRPIGRRALSVVLGLVLGSGTGLSADAALATELGPRPARTLTDLLQASSLVVQGQIEEVTTEEAGRVIVAFVHIEEVVKGARPPSDRLSVLEDLLFPSDSPSYHAGSDVLLFLEDLPTHSRWREYHAKGVRCTAVGNAEGVKEMPRAAIGRAIAFLRRHGELAPREEPTGKSLYLDFLLASLDDPVDLVQEAAARSLGRSESPERALDHKGWARIERAIRDRRRSLAARQSLVESFGSVPDLAGAIAEVIRTEPQMRRAALRSARGNAVLAQASLGPCLEDEDPEVRTAALGFVSADSPAQWKRQVETMALRDPSPEVRARAMTVAGSSRGTEAREILVRGLEDASPLVAYAAADALRKSDGRAAVPDLQRLLDSKNEKSRLIGILMLAAVNEERSREILRAASRNHPDSKTRERCAKVLEPGGSSTRSVESILGLLREPYTTP